MRPTLTVIVDPADRWMTKAACVGQAPSYDETATQWEQRKAQALCLTSCPVIEECREWARRTKFTGTAAGEKFLYGRRRGRPGPQERRNRPPLLTEIDETQQAS
ncbi:transcription factor WhiB [Kribbella rubisoli]|uniref:Transcription factor WhiB n=1 Tax=Kribbella rubisoli TaxID=3075929 RepID=A0A4Q7X5Q2_9ACTN|nr:WhiB family transcriptional regulator [Kribbella rubisoli]RZU18467.1 transcription factor WhiB [Kribbella rubisoli]